MTRPQWKAAFAWLNLLTAYLDRGVAPSTDHKRWLERRWGVRAWHCLTGAQARHASRQLNAWRAGVEGRA